MTPKEVLALIRQREVTTVDLRFMDFPGVWQHFSIPADALAEETFEEGIGFDGSSVVGWRAINEADLLVVPQSETALIDPFTAQPTLTMVCNIQDPITQQDYTRDPRNIARKAVSHMRSTGIADSCVLAPELEKLTLIELEHSSAERLRSKFSPPVDVIEGDATKMPFEDGRFSAVVCFTMLHHVPSPELQDALMAEACRVLRPGGTFAGTDSLGGGVAFTVLHVADTFVRVPPETLAERLRSAGFADPITVETNSTSVRFRATKPG